MRRVMELPHILVSVARGWDDSHVELERHGEDPSVLVSLQATGGNKALGIEDGSCNPESLGPVALLRFK
jgi:hypothetical protein